MQKALIWAQASNGVIGRNNALPWYLPNDLKYFKAVTLGKPVIMGRKTFDSIGKPLPGRTNIVLTRQPDALPAGVIGVTSLAEAYAQAEAKALIDGQDEVIIMGGAQLYALALPDADRLYITHVHAEVEGDAWAPDVDWTQFVERQREDFAAEEPNPYAYSFAIYERHSGA